MTAVVTLAAIVAAIAWLTEQSFPHPAVIPVAAERRGQTGAKIYHR